MLAEGAGERAPLPEAPRPAPAEGGRPAPPSEAQKAKATALVEGTARKLKSVPG